MALMDPLSKEILTNPHFDYSQLTWEKCLPMFEFWIARFANPEAACKAWIGLLSKNSPAIFNRMYKSINHGSISAVAEDAAFFKPLFDARNGKRDQVEEITDFDCRAAMLQHGGWSEWAKNSIQK